MNLLFISLTFSAFLLNLPLSNAAADKDEVKSLFGLSWKPSFRHYSGYLHAGPNKFLHYWFVESQRFSTDPLVLWLNGGPGCSSMEGFLSEHGPFLVSQDGKSLTPNRYSWNLIAHVLYIESPVGVGFSYATDHNYTASDDDTSLQNYRAIKSFFSLFPEYKGHDFFATGESYGGIYIPTLAVRLAQDPAINLKGFAIGNGLTDYNYNLNSMLYFAYNHGLIGEKLWLEAVLTCCKDGNSTLGNCDFSKKPCEPYVNEIFGIISSLNVYNLYGKCFYNTNNDNNNNNNINEIKKRNKDFIANRYFGYVNNHLQKKEPASVPCVDTTAITTYLNLIQVRKDLHIPDFIDYWAVCTELDYTRTYASVREHFLKLLSSGKYRALVFNGDVDMACNFLGDQWFVESLGFKMTQDRAEWYYIDPTDNTKQVAGFIKKFKNLSFLTVKGSGHMVPQDKPLQAIFMFKQFLDGSF